MQPLKNLQDEFNNICKKYLSSYMEILTGLKYLYEMLSANKQKHLFFIINIFTEAYKAQYPTHLAIP